MHPLAKKIINVKRRTITIVLGLSVTFAYRVKCLNITPNTMSSMPDFYPKDQANTKMGKQFCKNAMELIQTGNDVIFKAEIFEQTTPNTNDIFSVKN